MKQKEIKEFKYVQNTTNKRNLDWQKGNKTEHWKSHGLTLNFLQTMGQNFFRKFSSRSNVFVFNKLTDEPTNVCQMCSHWYQGKLQHSLGCNNRYGHNYICCRAGRIDFVMRGGGLVPPPLIEEGPFMRGQDWLDIKRWVQIFKYELYFG